MSLYTYFLVYADKERKTISVEYVSTACDYEIDDYRLVSRKRFYERLDAVNYAHELCEMHDKQYVSDENEDYLLD